MSFDFNDSFTGLDFAAYQSPEDGLFVCRFIDFATIQVPRGDRANRLREALSKAQEVGPAAIDDVLIKMEGDWKLPSQRDADSPAPAKGLDVH